MCAGVCVLGVGAKVWVLKSLSLPLGLSCLRLWVQTGPSFLSPFTLSLLETPYAVLAQVKSLEVGSTGGDGTEGVSCQNGPEV